MEHSMSGTVMNKPQGNADLLIPAQVHLVVITKYEMDAYISLIDKEGGKRLAEDLVKLKVILTKLGQGENI